jgi:hypothetical protein
MVEARRLVALSDRVAQSSLPIVMDQAQASAIGARLLQDAWVMRETATFGIAPSQIALDPTDEVELTAGGRVHRMRITEIDDTASRAVQAAATDPSIYDVLTGPQRSATATQTLSSAGRTLTVFLDLPLLAADQSAWEPFAAAYAKPWPGGVVVMQSATQSNYQLDATLTLAADIGVTTTDLYSGPSWRWDEANTLGVTLYGGALTSLDDISIFAGANALAIQNGNGDWEVLQFATATLIAPQTWTLSRLLRGQAGTEGAMQDPVPAGARVVVLNDALRQLPIAQSQYALPFNYLWGPQNKAISDPSFQGAEMTFEGVGLRPFPPCQLKAVRSSSGADIVLSWVRRDRSPSADGWEQTEIPQSEASESYDLEILNAAGDVVRTFANVSAPAQIYMAAQMAADFPSGLPSPFRFTAYQISTVFGRGPGKTANFYFS